MRLSPSGGSSGFEASFYYIEYALALTGAIGMWARYRKDHRETIEAYEGVLYLGASRSLPELFEAAGLEWGFWQPAMRKFAGELSSAIRGHD